MANYAKSAKKRANYHDLVSLSGRCIAVATRSPALLFPHLFTRGSRINAIRDKCPSLHTMFPALAIRVERINHPKHDDRSLHRADTRPTSITCDAILEFSCETFERRANFTSQPDTRNRVHSIRDTRDTNPRTIVYAESFLS